MDSRLFRVSADDISEFFVASNEGDVTYFKNVTSNILLWEYIYAADWIEKC